MGESAIPALHDWARRLPAVCGVVVELEWLREAQWAQAGRVFLRGAT